MPPRKIALYALLGILAAAGSAGVVYAVFAARRAASPADVVITASPDSGDVQANKLSEVSGVLTLPSDGGVWPWPVAAASAEAPAVPVSLSHHISDGKGGRRVHVAAGTVNATAGKAVLALSGFDSKSRPKEKWSWGEIWLCDLTTGKVTHQWETKKALAPLDLHPDGRRFLLRLNGAGLDLDMQRVELWELTTEGKVRRRTWRPFSDGQKKNTSIMGVDDARHQHVPEAQVKWAGFVGQAHIATLHGATLHLWDLTTLDPIGEFGGVVGWPAVSPDGGKVGFLTADTVALLDPATRKIVSARRFRTPPHPVLTFHPSGTSLAAVGAGRTAVLDLITGQSWDAMIAELKTEEPGDYAHLKPACGWAGDNHIFYRGELFDFDMPIPVWRYSWSDWVGVHGRSVWAVANDSGAREAVLRPFTLPHKGMKERLHQMLSSSNVFALRPGDPVQIDVAGLPAEKRDEVKAALEKRLRKLGYKPDPEGAVTFKASVDGIPTRKTEKYSNGIVITYDERLARLEVMKGGAVIWKAANAVGPPVMLPDNPNETPGGFTTEYGRPAYEIFTERPLPAVLREGRSSGALGSSSFTAQGVVDK